MRDYHEVCVDNTASALSQQWDITRFDRLAKEKLQQCDAVFLLPYADLCINIAVKIGSEYSAFLKNEALDRKDACMYLLYTC